MRFLFMTVAAALLWCGCVSSGKKRGTTEAGRSGKEPAGGTAAKVIPIQQIHGKVVSANAALRFVVIDFYLSEMPEMDRRMNVYRQGQKVAEVKITGPVIRNNIAADITAGEAQVGDEVRAE